MHTIKDGSMPDLLISTIEKPSGAINTEGLTTDTTNGVNFAMSVRVKS